jgi:formate-dependent phosphoribosylglycinamide formyltransferase (GAR transformylase)
MSSQKNTLVLLGYRKKAIEAATRLGFRILLWVEKFPAKMPAQAVESIIVAPFVEHENELDPTILQTLRQYYPINIVTPLIESSVIAAALLRKILGLKGHDVELASRCHNKFLMKSYARAHQIPVTDFRRIDDTLKVEELIALWGFPIVIKQNDSSGGRYLSTVMDEGSLRNALKPGWLAEKWIAASYEGSIESFIVDGEILFTNFTEYYKHYEINIVPGNLNAHLKEKIIALNQQIIKAFGIHRGMTHMEFFCVAEDVIFGEIAIRPPGGYLMDLISYAYECDAWEIFLQCELGQIPQLPKPSQCTTAAWIIHPGFGKISDITGLENISSLPGIVEARFNLKEGMVCNHRVGSGEEYAHILLKTSNRQQIIDTLETLQNTLAITIDANFDARGHESAREAGLRRG